MADFYRVLGVPPTADADAIRAAYRALIRRYHPDRQPDDRARAEARVREITEAYATLGDPARRARYDHARAAARRTYARPAYARPAYAYARPAYAGPAPQPSSSGAPDAPQASRVAGPWAWIGALAVALPLAALIAWRAAVSPPEPAAPMEVVRASTMPEPAAAVAAPRVTAVPAAPAGWTIERGAYGCFASLPVDATRSLLLLPYPKVGQGGIGVRDRTGIAMQKNQTWVARADNDEVPFFHPTAEGPDTVWLGEVVNPGLDSFVTSAASITIAAEKPRFFLYAPLSSVTEALAAARRCQQG